MEHQPLTKHRLAAQTTERSSSVRGSMLEECLEPGDERGRKRHQPNEKPDRKRRHPHCIEAKETEKSAPEKTDERKDRQGEIIGLSQAGDAMDRQPVGADGNRSDQERNQGRPESGLKGGGQPLPGQPNEVETHTRNQKSVRIEVVLQGVTRQIEKRPGESRDQHQRKQGEVYHWFGKRSRTSPHSQRETIHFKRFLPLCTTFDRNSIFDKYSS